MIATKERQLSIKDIIVVDREPAKEPLFDPKEYLTVDTPEWAMKTIHNSMSLKSHNTNRFNVKVSAQDECAEVLKQQYVKSSAVDEIKKLKNSRKWRVYLRHLAMALLAYPEARHEFEIDKSKSEKLLQWTNDGLTDNLNG